MRAWNSELAMFCLYFTDVEAEASHIVVYRLLLVLATSRDLAIHGSMFGTTQRPPPI